MKNSLNIELQKTEIIYKTACFLKKYGLKSMTMNNCAIAIGISKRKIYSVFNNKEDLLISCINFMLVEFEMKIMTVKYNTENPIIRFIEIHNQTMEYLSQFSNTFYFDLKRNLNLKVIIQDYTNRYKSNTIYPIFQFAKNIIICV